MIEGSGIDIVEIKQMREAHKKWGNNFLKKIFAPKEIAYSFKKRFPYQHLAGRFAAKEATIKAFSNGWGKSIDLSSIEVSNDKDGKPRIKLKGNFKKLCEKRKLNEIVISMSHSKNFAVASCILIKNK